MATPEPSSKFEQMKSRRHFLNELGQKPLNQNKDRSIASDAKPSFIKHFSKQPSEDQYSFVPAEKKSKPFLNNEKVYALEYNNFKHRILLANEEDYGDDSNKYNSPQTVYRSKSQVSNGNAFINDRSQFGDNSSTKNSII